MWTFKKNSKFTIEGRLYLRGWKITKEDEKLLNITKDVGLLKMILKMMEEYQTRQTITKDIQCTCCIGPASRDSQAPAKDDARLLKKITKMENYNINTMKDYVLSTESDKEKYNGGAKLIY